MGHKRIQNKLDELEESAGEGAPRKRGENAEEEGGPTQAEVQHAAAKLRRAGSAKPGRAKALARKLLSAGMDVNHFCRGTGRSARRELRSRRKRADEQKQRAPSSSQGAPRSRASGSGPAADGDTIRVEHAKALLGDNRATDFVLRGIQRHGPSGQRVARADVEERKRERAEERYRQRVERFEQQRKSGSTITEL